MVTRTIISGEGSVLGIDKKHFTYRMAFDFFEKGISATNAFHKTSWDFANKDHWLLCFPVCMLAFSLELAIKCYLSDEQIQELKDDKKGHYLIDLYNALDPDAQTKIEAHFDWCGSFKNNLLRICYKPDSIPDTNKTYSSNKELILCTLKECNDAFSKFRYFYELNANKEYYFNFNTLVRLIHACLAEKKRN